MRWSRTKKDKKLEIIEEKLNNPDSTLKEIQEITWVPISTANDIIKNIPEEVRKSSEKWETMIDKLDSIIDSIVNITKISMNKFEAKAASDWLSTKEVKDLSDIAKTNFDRKQLLTNKPTEIKKIDVDLEGKSLKELEKIRQELLNS